MSRAPFNAEECAQGGGTGPRLGQLNLKKRRQDGRKYFAQGSGSPTAHRPPCDPSLCLLAKEIDSSVRSSCHSLWKFARPQSFRPPRGVSGAADCSFLKTRRFFFTAAGVHVCFKYAGIILSHIFPSEDRFPYAVKGTQHYTLLLCKQSVPRHIIRAKLGASFDKHTFQEKK